MQDNKRGWANPDKARKNNQRILIACRAGEKYKDIAARFEVSVQRVSVIARENGLRRRKERVDKVKPDKPTPKLTELGVQGLAARNRICLALLAGQKLSAPEVSKLLLMTPSAVNHVKARYGKVK